jgi:hypothetical protein
MAATHIVPLLTTFTFIFRAIGEFHYVNDSLEAYSLDNSKVIARPAVLPIHT